MCVRGGEWFVLHSCSSYKIGNAFLVKFLFRIYASLWFFIKEKGKDKSSLKGGIPF